MQDEALTRYSDKIVGLIHDGVMIVDVNGNIIEMNQALIDITGYSEGELVGKPCMVLKCSSCKKVIDVKGRHWCRLFNVGDISMQNQMHRF